MSLGREPLYKVGRCEPRNAFPLALLFYIFRIDIKDLPRRVSSHRNASPRALSSQHYEEHCSEMGHDPVNQASFGKLIRSVFPSLKVGPHPFCNHSLPRLPLSPACSTTPMTPVVFPHFFCGQTRRLGTRGNSKYHYYGIRLKDSSDLIFEETQVPSGASLSCLVLTAVLAKNIDLRLRSWFMPTRLAGHTTSTATSLLARYAR
jgi:hypothetical protein